MHNVEDERTAGLLVSNGAHHLVEDSNGWTPLHTNRDEDVLRYLLTLPGAEKFAQEAAEVNEGLAKILEEDAPPSP